MRPPQHDPLRGDAERRRNACLQLACELRKKADQVAGDQEQWPAVCLQGQGVRKDWFLRLDDNQNVMPPSQRLIRGNFDFSAAGFQHDGIPVHFRPQNVLLAPVPS